MFTTRHQRYGPTNKRPPDSELKLKIQQERDFAIARALSEGRGPETFAISNLPDEHFKNIIVQKETNKKPPGTA